MKKRTTSTYIRGDIGRLIRDMKKSDYDFSNIIRSSLQNLIANHDQIKAIDVDSLIYNDRFVEYYDSMLGNFNDSSEKDKWEKLILFLHQRRSDVYYYDNGDAASDFKVIRAIEEINSSASVDEVKEECMMLISQLIDQKDCDLIDADMSISLLKLLRFLKAHEDDLDLLLVRRALQFLNERHFVRVEAGKLFCYRCDEIIHDSCECLLMGSEKPDRHPNDKSEYPPFMLDNEAEVILAALKLGDNENYWNLALEFFANIHNGGIKRVPDYDEWMNSLKDGLFQPDLPPSLMFNLMIEK